MYIPYVAHGTQQDGGVGFCTYPMWHMAPNRMEAWGFVHTLCGTLHPTGWRRGVFYIPYVAHGTQQDGGVGFCTYPMWHMAPNRMEAWGFVHTLCGTWHPTGWMRGVLYMPYVAHDTQQDGGVGFCTYPMWHMAPNRMEAWGFVHTLCGTWHPTGWRRGVLYIPYVAHGTQQDGGVGFCTYPTWHMTPNRMEAWGFVHTLCGTWHPTGWRRGVLYIPYVAHGTQQDGGVGFCTYPMWHIAPNRMEAWGFVHTLCGTWHPTGWRRGVLYIPYVAHGTQQDGGVGFCTYPMWHMAPNRMEAWGFVHTLHGTWHPTGWRRGVLYIPYVAHGTHQDGGVGFCTYPTWHMAPNRIEAWGFVHTLGGTWHPTEWMRGVLYMPYVAHGTQQDGGVGFCTYPTWHTAPNRMEAWGFVYTLRGTWHPTGWRRGVLYIPYMAHGTQQDGGVGFCTYPTWHMAPNRMEAWGFVHALCGTWHPTGWRRGVLYMSYVAHGTQQDGGVGFCTYPAWHMVPNRMEAWGFVHTLRGTWYPTGWRRGVLYIPYVAHDTHVI